MRIRMAIFFTLLTLSLASTNYVALAGPPPQSTAHYIIKGRVQDSAGQPLPGVTVCASPKDPSSGARIVCEQSASDGGFLILQNRSGRYQLDASRPGHVSPHLPFYREPGSPLVEVKLSKPGTDTFVLVTLAPKNGVLKGRALDASTGLPIGDMRVVQCHTDNPQICFGQSAKSEDGNFRIAAPHVPFTLRITATGYEEWFGLTGEGRQESIHLPSGETTELAVSLKRRADSADKPLHEKEKQVGVHLQSPVQLSPEAGARFSHYPRSTKLEWARVEGAVAYTVEVDFCQGSAKYATSCVSPQPHQVNPVSMPASETTYVFNFVGAQPGRWRVWATDKEGREGFKSAWRLFAYLR